MMKSKNITNLCAGILAVTLTTSTSAKKIYPAEIMGRDLNYPGLGWLGHVGIATTTMSSPQGMLENADQVIEVLNETPVVQINSISNFKARSKYWGSKYGVADRGAVGYSVLVEANHQRWWCPKYTSDTKYHIGSGNPATGQVIECGTWRCDTYVWWAFYSQGLDTMPGRVWLPKKVFNNFPFYNDERFSSTTTKAPTDSRGLKSLASVTTQELNDMPYDEFHLTMNNAPDNYLSSESAIQMQLACDTNLSEVKRGIMIDRLISDDTENNLVTKLLALFRETKSTEVKNKIVEGLMLYNQRHRNVEPYIHNTQPELKSFFAELLNTETLTSKQVDDAVRGFIDTHTAEEATLNQANIDKWLQKTNHYSSVMLKYTLAHKSADLQEYYIKSIIEELREANNSDLDSYFFGPLSIGYTNSGSLFLEPGSRQAVIKYLKEVRHKYSKQPSVSLAEDIHKNTTAPYYFELIKSMGTLSTDQS